VHPLVAMTYAGLMNSTYSNMEEAFKQFTILTRVPIWSAWEETLEQGFALEYPGVEIEFDTDDVQALKPNMADVEASVIAQFTSNIITQNEAREALGYDLIIGANRFAFELSPMTAAPTTIVPPPDIEVPPEEEEDAFPFFDGEVTSDYLGNKVTEEWEQMEWKRQDTNLEMYAGRVAKDFAKIAAQLEKEIVSEVKMMGAIETKADPFNFSSWVRKFVDGTKRSLQALTTAVIGDSLEKAGTTIEEFGFANFEAVVRTSASLSAGMITESVGTIRDELHTLITENANTTAEELTDIIKAKFSTIKDSRARLIGRTTTTATSGRTQRDTWAKRNTQIQDPKMKIVPVWLTQNDSKVRDAHAALNRSTPNAEGYWLLAGSPVKYPADSAADAAQACNCRCNLVPTKAGRI